MTWELRHFIEPVFVTENMLWNTPTTSSPASSCAFCAGYYLGVATYVLRWGLGRIRSLACYTQCIRVSSLKKFVLNTSVAEKLYVSRGRMSWIPYVLTRDNCTHFSRIMYTMTHNDSVLNFRGWANSLTLEINFPPNLAVMHTHTTTHRTLASIHIYGVHIFPGANM